MILLKMKRDNFNNYSGTNALKILMNFSFYKREPNEISSLYKGTLKINMKKNAKF